MEFLKNIGDEITRSLDSTPQKDDKTNENGLYDHSENKLTREEDDHSTSKETIKQQTNNDEWGRWEQTPPKTTPINVTPTNIKPVSSTSSPAQGTKMATTPVKSTRLGELSKDELIERIKKQTVLLQRLKTRSEELSKECNKLKTQVTDDHMTSKDEHLVQELQVMKTERDRALIEVKSVKQIVTDTDNEMKRATESLEKEVSVLKNENISFKNRIEQMEKERSTMEDNLQLEINTLKQELSSCKKNDNEIQDTMKKEREDAMKKEREDAMKKEREDAMKKEREDAMKKEREDAMKKEREDAMKKEREDAMKKEREDAMKKEREDAMKKEREDAMKKEREEVLAERDSLINQLSDVNSLLSEEKSLRGNERVEFQKKLTTMNDTVQQTTKEYEEKIKKMVDGFEKEREDDKERTMKEREELLEICKVRENEVAILKEKEAILIKKQEKLQLHEVSERNSQEEEKKDQLLQNELVKLKNEFTETQRQHQMIIGEYDKEKRELMESREKDIKSLEKEIEEMKQRNEEEKTKETTEMQNASREEIKKYKAVAVKLKKELSETKDKEAVLRDQIGSDGKTRLELNNEIDLIKKELGSGKDQLNEFQKKISEKEKEIKLLEEKLSDQRMKNEQLLTDRSEQSAEMTDNCAKLEESNRSLQQKVSSLTNTLTNVNTELGNAKETVDKYDAEVSSLKEALSQERNLVSETQQKLAILEKDVKSSSLIDLELADYQRSIDGLKNQIIEKQEMIAEFEKRLTKLISQNEQLERERDDVKNDVTAKEEMSTRLKAMLRKTTKDLTDSKNQVTEMQKQVDQFHEEIELKKREEEESKVEIATLAAKIQANDNEYQSSVTGQQQTIQSLESKVARLHKDLQQRKEEIVKMNEEHEGYKVRVHSVLKQKSTAPSVNEIESELRHKHEVELLKAKAELKETREQLSTLLVEHEEIISEYHQLTNNHDQLLSASKMEKQHLNDRLFEAEGKFTTRTRELEDVIVGLRENIINNTQAFKNQLHILQETHNQQLLQLQQHLDSTTADLNRLQQDVDSQTLAARRSTLQNHSRENSVAVKLNEITLLSEERSAGEGMDNDELKNTTTEVLTGNTTISLERLLSTSTNDTATNVHSKDEIPVDVNLLHTRLESSVKKTCHLTELLHETEENCIRLTDQAKLLKEEIRRLERNNGRQREASNMEYLKNVVLKFLHTENSDERVGLIPVITRLLQLSQQEINYLSQTIKGNKVALPDPTGISNPGEGGAKGLGTYLHRWTGY